MAYTPASTLQAVEALYIGYFGRAGEPGGVSYWVNQINNGQTFAQAAAAFSVQAEAKAQHPFLTNPGLVSPADFVESLYTQLFGRASDAAGKAYWVAQLQAANGNPFAYGLLVAQFISGAQNDANGQDLTVIQNKVTAAEYFTGKLASAGIQGTDDKGQVTAAVDQAATDVLSGVTKDAASITAANNKTDAFVSGAGTGTTYNLTTATDNVPGTSGNDIINGALSGTAANNTFSLLDTLDGAGGIDRFNLVLDTGAGAFPAATIKNVENFYIRNVSGARQTIDFGTIVGEQQAWNDRSTSSVTFNNLAAGATVGVNGDGSSTLSDTTASFEAAVTAGKVAVANGTVGAGIINVSGAGLTSLDITSSGGSNKIGYLGITTGAVKTVNVIATSDFLTTTGAQGIFDGGGIAANATLNVSGAGKVDIRDLSADFVTVDASKNSGGLTVNLNTGIKTFAGSTGNDKVTTNALTAATESSINAGAGTADELVIRAGTDVDTAAEAKWYSGFEVLNVGAQTVDASLFTNSAIDAIKIGGNANVSNLTAAQASKITIYADSNATIGLKDATNPGTIDTAKIVIDDGATAKSTITLANITTPGVENLEFSLTDNLTITSLTGTAGASSYKFAGSGNLSVTTGATAVPLNTTFDASGTSGTLTIDASAATGNAVTIKAGTGAATITGTAAADSIVGGSGGGTYTGGGGADLINLTASVAKADIVKVNTTDVTQTAYDKISGFTNGVGTTTDTLDLNGAASVAANVTNFATTVAGVTVTSTDGLITFGGANAGTATLAQLITAASDSIAVANASAAFVFGGNTYVFQSVDATAGFGAGDIVVELTGVTGIAGLSLAAGANLVHIA